MSEPLISVIMPAYNAGLYIAESIQSVLQQTYQNWELIIVDDGSTDNTAAIIAAFIEQDNRIKYFYQLNGRQGKAKNKGIANSNGKYIAFLDADDIWVPSKLDKCIKFFQETSCSLVFTDCYIFEGALPASFSSLKRMGVIDTVYQGRDALLHFLYCNRIPNLTVVTEKQLILDAGGFTDKTVAEEYEMWLKLLANGAVFKAIGEPLALYRVHEGSITAKDRHATFEVMEIVKAFGLLNKAYREECNKIVREKIKHWLYNGTDRNSKRFRQAIGGVFAWPVFFF